MEFMLSIHWDVSPEIFSIGFLALRYYGILFVSGFLVGYYILQRIFTTEGKSTKDLDNLIIYSFIFTIIGARLGHVLFYEFNYYIENPGEIIKIWRGGLASHGGTVGMLLFFLYYARKKKINLLWIFDRVCIPGALGAAFIRIGNLFNSEIYGTETDLPWGFIFVREGETIAKHPTQIYEALGYIIIFSVLLLLYNKYKKATPGGLIAGWFFILLFGFRFFIEFLKEIQVDFEKTMILNMGQILSIPFVILGIILILRIKKTHILLNNNADYGYKN